MHLQMYLNISGMFLEEWTTAVQPGHASCYRQSLSRCRSKSDDTTTMSGKKKIIKNHWKNSVHVNYIPNIPTFHLSLSLPSSWQKVFHEVPLGQEILAMQMNVTFNTWMLFTIDKTTFHKRNLVKCELRLFSPLLGWQQHRIRSLWQKCK